MNHKQLIDSKLSLDDPSQFDDPAGMLSQPYQLYIERSDPSKNMARYYAMSIEPSLFGEICLLRKWGRIGTKGQMMIHSFAAEEEAVKLFLHVLHHKRKRGYRPRTSTLTHGPLPHGPLPSDADGQIAAATAGRHRSNAHPE